MTGETKEVIEIMKSLFNSLNDKIDTTKQELQKDISDIKERVIKIETTLENETNRNIRLLAEGHQPLVDKVDILVEDMDIVKFDVDVIKKVVTTHSKELNKLGRVK